MLQPQEIHALFVEKSQSDALPRKSFPEAGAPGYVPLPLMSQQIKKALNRIFGLVLKLFANALLQRARDPFREIFLWILRSTGQVHGRPVKAISFLDKDFLLYARQPFQNRHRKANREGGVDLARLDRPVAFDPRLILVFRDEIGKLDMLTAINYLSIY
jgi:hypothetical protein